MSQRVAPVDLSRCPFCGADKLLTIMAETEVRPHDTREEFAGSVTRASFRCTDCGAALTGSAPRAPRMFPLGDVACSATVDAAKGTISIKSREDWSRLFGGTAPDFGHTELLELPGYRGAFTPAELDAFRAAYQKHIDGQLTRVFTPTPAPRRACYEPEPFETEE